MAKRKRQNNKDDGAYRAPSSRKGTGNVNTMLVRHTRQKTKTATCQAVFYTAELLERIFEYLSPQQIISAQRVCRQFRDIVKTSPGLQSALFLSVATDGVKEEWVVTDDDPTALWNISCRFQPSWRDPEVPGAVRYTVTTVNSMILEHACASDWGRPLHAQRVSASGGEVCRAKGCLMTALGLKMHGQNTSLDQMFLSKPPVSDVEVIFHARFRHGASVEVICGVQSPEGLTVSQFLDHILDGSSTQIIHEPSDDNKGVKRTEVNVDTFRQTALRLEKKYGGIDLEEPADFLLVGYVVPTRDEEVSVRKPQT